MKSENIGNLGSNGIACVFVDPDQAEDVLDRIFIPNFLHRNHSERLPEKLSCNENHGEIDALARQVILSCMPGDLIAPPYYGPIVTLKWAAKYLFQSDLGSREDTMQIIDKETLEIVAELKPEPGKTFAHVEFTKDGKYVLASLWDMDGALIIYDAVTLKEVKRLPMKKPVGKYNVWNKITKSEGTSH